MLRSIRTSLAVEKLVKGILDVHNVIDKETNKKQNPIWNKFIFNFWLKFVMMSFHINNLNSIV